MKTFAFLALALTLCWGASPSVARAQSTQDLQSASIRAFTLEACGSHADSGVWNTLERSSQTALIIAAHAMSDSLANTRAFFRISSTLETLIENRSFYEALQDCYGNDVTAKTAFFTSLVFADIAGKATGVLLIAYAARLLLKFGNMLKAYSPRLHLAAISVAVSACISSIYEAVNELLERQRKIRMQTSVAEQTADILGQSRTEIQARSLELANRVYAKIDYLLAQLESIQDPIERQQLLEKLTAAENIGLRAYH